MPVTSFRLRANSQEREIEADDQAPLLDLLRNACNLKGTRFGCGTGECGACEAALLARAVPGRPVRLL